MPDHLYQAEFSTGFPRLAPSKFRLVDLPRVALVSLLPPPSLSLPPSERNNTTSVVSMSSARQATSSSISNSHLIIDALADYTNMTGIDLSENTFATELELSNSPQGILHLFQNRVKASRGDQDGNQRLVDCLSSTVSVLQAFSGILGEVVGGLVSNRTRTIL